MIRHTEPDLRTSNMLSELSVAAADLLAKVPRSEVLKHHKQSVSILPNTATVAEKYLFFALVSLRPNLTWELFSAWYTSLEAKRIKKISSLLHSEFTHHNHLPHWSRTAGTTLEVEMTVSEAIDFNRHRAWGRFTPFLDSDETVELLTHGFITPAYLDIPELTDLRAEFATTLKKYYKQLAELAEDLPEGTSPHFIRSLVPNAQRLRYFLSGGPKEISYLTQLRVRPGGHINYRLLAHEMAKVAAKSDPLLGALDFGPKKKPDPNSRTEFFDRS